MKRLASVSDWKPISTAPKDATEILVWTRVAGRQGPLVAHYAHGGGEDQPSFGPGWFYWTGGCFSSLETTPTHWAPISAPPGG